MLANKPSKKSLQHHSGSYGGHQQLQQMIQPNHAIGGYNITPGPDSGQLKKYYDVYEKQNRFKGNEVTRNMQGPTG